MSRCRASIAMALMAWVCSVNAADKTEALVDVGKERIESERSVQARVDAIGEETGKLEDQYLQVLKTNADLEIYERLLDEQLANQQREIGSIENSISNATLIERQLMPLLTRMVDALGSYIELDLPFLIEERRARVDKLRKLLVRADLTTAEKCRRVLEAYQIENDYGRTIEAYKGRLELADGVFDVVAARERTHGAANVVASAEQLRDAVLRDEAAGTGNENAVSAHTKFLLAARAPRGCWRDPALRAGGRGRGDRRPS